MIDNFAILFSTLMVVFIVLRAARLDRVLPWFETRSLHEQKLRQEAAAKEVTKHKVVVGWRPRPSLDASTSRSGNRR